MSNIPARNLRPKVNLIVCLFVRLCLHLFSPISTHFLSRDVLRMFFSHFHFPVFAVIIYFVIRLNLFVDCGLTNCNQNLWLTDIQYSLLKPGVILAKTVQGIRDEIFLEDFQWIYILNYILLLKYGREALLHYVFGRVYYEKHSEA